MIKMKKGQFNQVMILILILASAVVIILFITKFASRSTMDESINACRLSVMAQSATTWGLVSKTSPLDIGCDKRYVNFYNTKVELGLSLENMNPISIYYGDAKVKKFSELNEFVVDQVIAEELRVCKFEFGDGKIKIFPNDKGDLLENSRVCFVCSEINFKPGVPQQVFKGLKDYTKKTTFADSGLSYNTYLTEETIFNNSMWAQGTTDAQDIIKLINQEDAGFLHMKSYIEKYFDLDIDSSKSYAVVVQKNAPAKMKWLAGPLSNIFLSRNAIWVMVVPTTDLNQYCDLQAS